MSSHSQSYLNTSSSTTDTTVHHSTHTHRVTNCASEVGNDNGEGTHVSEYAVLMRGKHDQHLQLPFTGDVIIELLNWREDKEHHKKMVTIVESHGFV